MQTGRKGWSRASGAAGPRSSPISSHAISNASSKKVSPGQRTTWIQLIEDELGVSYHPGHVSRLLRRTYGMSYSIPRPETPSRPENAEEILAERLEDALGEIEADRAEEGPDSEGTVLGFFR